MKQEIISPIAMKCSQEQFDEIRPILEKNGLVITGMDSFEDFSYLVNNYANNLGNIANLGLVRRSCNGRAVFEEWNKYFFLKYCGITLNDEVKTPEVESEQYTSEELLYLYDYHLGSDTIRVYIKENEDYTLETKNLTLNQAQLEETITYYKIPSNNIYRGKNGNVLCFNGYEMIEKILK
jgi:hypothetical protein